MDFLMAANVIISQVFFITSWPSVCSPTKGNQEHSTFFFFLNGTRLAQHANKHYTGPHLSPQPCAPV